MAAAPQVREAESPLSTEPELLHRMGQRAVFGARGAARGAARERENGARPFFSNKVEPTDGLTDR